MPIKIVAKNKKEKGTKPTMAPKEKGTKPTKAPSEAEIKKALSKLTVNQILNRYTKKGKSGPSITSPRSPRS